MTIFICTISVQFYSRMCLWNIATYTSDTFYISWT